MTDTSMATDPALTDPATDNLLPADDATGKEMLENLAAALDALPAEALVDTTTPAPTTTDKDTPAPSTKRKNPRFGRNADGTPAKKADKKEVVRKSEWGRFLAAFKASHPLLCSVEATIEARKIYRPANGKQKSFERMFKEVWKQRNPKWALMSKAELATNIRNDFIKAF